MSLLSYDDTAFCYFLFGLIIPFLIPLSFFHRKCFVLILLCYIFISKLDSSISQYDPLAILNLSKNSSPSDIKKAYHKLALKWHPDKNQDPKAQSTFILINKAYNHLIDGSNNSIESDIFELSIGLPSILIKQDNQLYVLLIYLVFLTLIIPFSIINYLSNSFQYTENNILKASYVHYNKIMDHSVEETDIPEILAFSEEFINYTRNKNFETDNIQLKFETTNSIVNQNVKKGLFLIKNNKIPFKLFEKIPKLLDAMIDVALIKQKFFALKSIIHYKQKLNLSIEPTNITIKVDIFTDDENEISNLDLITFKIKGHVDHTNCEWLFLLRYQQSIIALERFKPESLDFFFSLYAFGPFCEKTCHVGKNQVFLYIFGDCDKIIPLYFSVVDYISLEPYKPHPEDEKLKDQPTLFNSLLGKIKDESDDEN